ncbi:DNA-binding transcriptional regulator, MarR family [Nakamurella panacisegetis]|uniref:DNA-binding transcriptional regulator, MarR family n=1 Tax=Nakamurella panacisegetis TaxID=1090615 RepID=A0A1H0IZJ2_9ACTN|nr:MarR family winged helix-turn-helix transcriptional regulator [Nakamurella panacisegetis]SDO36743.1 DNA-binding transcriptional regulator, MarR family [Nakamurella panacisegetis]
MIASPQPALDPDDDEVTDAVLAAARVLVGVAIRSIAAAEESIGVNQFRALVIIASRGPLHSAALAEAMGLHPSNATRTCDRLVAEKLLDRRDNPADRRHLQLILTKKGRRLVDGVMNRRRTLIKGILAQMPDGDRRQLADVLNEFAQAGGEPAEQDLWSVGWTTQTPDDNGAP